MKGGFAIKMKTTILILAIATIFLFVPLVQAGCLTDIERTELQLVTNGTGASYPLILNLFERICQADYINQTLNEKVKDLDDVFDDKIKEVTAIVNQSSYVDAINKISLLYAQSVNVTGEITSLENRLTDKINSDNGNLRSYVDNQSSNMLTSYASLEADVADTMTEKQTKSLSTNRILLMCGGIIALVGYLFVREYRKNQKKKAVPLPLKTINFTQPTENGTEQSKTSKVKPTGKRKAK